MTTISYPSRKAKYLSLNILKKPLAGDFPARGTSLFASYIFLENVDFRMF